MRIPIERAFALTAQTEQPYLARQQNWSNQLARHAMMQPGKTALRFLGHTTTWAELDERVTKLAGALQRRGVGPGDRVLILMLNRTEFVESFLAANRLGAIAVPVNFRMTPGALLDVLQAEEVTGIFLVPAQWQAVCAAQRAQPRNLRLRVLSWGAAPASDTLLKDMAETFPGALILAAFGQTEMSPVTCMLLGDDAIRKLGSVGRVIPTVSARIVDEDMNEVQIGQVGEIVYRAPTLMSGYWNNPKATAESFAGGWFHSGDLVRQDEEGYIWVVDRKKDMIISGGENIYCAEVENVLAAHPAIAEVAVIGRPHRKWGEVPVAVVVLSAARLTLAELDDFLTERLARYKHPKALEIVDALPRNPSGKVLKTELRSVFGVDLH